MTLRSIILSTGSSSAIGERVHDPDISRLNSVETNSPPPLQDKPYLQPLMEEVAAEKAEKNELDSIAVVRKH